jgi:putative CocE/NonD family hydrolase
LRTIKDLRIPMSDGITLAGDLYLPEGDGPFPALVSAYPYHKDDLIGELFDYPRLYFAEQGFADLLVDFRGTGSSEGYCPDNFDTELEGRDAAETIEWVAVQDWCDGNVGAWGLSYGGVNALNVASRRPPHLKASLSLYGTPDIYHDFIYPGGILNALGLWTRETFMVCMDLAPTTYQDPDGAWRELWEGHIQRLENGDLWSLGWQSHAEYDDHWRRRTTDCSAITVPTFIIGGWNDVFPDGAFRTFGALAGPKRIVIGPWVHAWPDDSTVEPWDWLPEAVRWWNRWLRDDHNGIDEAPPVRAFLQGAGTWIETEDLPAPGTAARTLMLAPDRSLRSDAPTDGSVEYTGDPRVGVFGSLFDPQATGYGFPREQALDNLRSACFTSVPLESDLDILGPIHAQLHVALEEGSELDLVAKVCAVDGDGSSHLVATGWLNGRHRNGHERNDPITPGEVNVYEVRLWAAGYRLRAGQRIRLAVSTSDWPHSFTTAGNPNIRIACGPSSPSCLVLPTLADPTGVQEVEIPRPDAGIDRAPALIESRPYWTITEDPVNEAVTVSFGSAEDIEVRHGPRYHAEFSAKARVGRHQPDGAGSTPRRRSRSC